MSHSPSPARLSTGIAGLDNILGGGLPATHLYLVEGDPGTGKTTLALQFLLAGVAQGERVLYVTLSESQRELAVVAESHGWSLSNVPIFEMAISDDELKPEAQYTVFHPSDVELADTTTAVLKRVEAIGPKRVVFDSLSELRMLARDPLRYRRQILGLKRFFAGRECTVLLLDDRTAEGNDLQLQSIAHGVLMMQSLERDFGVKRRRIEIRKLRGSKFREGFHDYVIETGGVTVFPRLVSAEHNDGTGSKRPIASGIPGLDELWGGGIDSGTSTLMMGPAGSGKSSIAARYAVSAAERGQHAAIFTFDETLATFVKRCESLGMKVSDLVKGGNLTIQQIDPAELSPGELVDRIRQMAETGAKVIVIDSLNGLMNAMPGEEFLTLQLHELLSYLNHKGVTTILTLAQHGFIGTGMLSPVDVSYLADSVMLFRYYESEGLIHNAVSVVKKRSGSHEKALRELHMKDGAIRVGEPLRRFEGVLTGVPKLRAS